MQCVSGYLLCFYYTIYLQLKFRTENVFHKTKNNNRDLGKNHAIRKEFMSNLDSLSEWIRDMQLLK